MGDTSTPMSVPLGAAAFYTGAVSPDATVWQNPALLQKADAACIRQAFSGHELAHWLQLHAKDYTKDGNQC
jgi:hypothetical protein